MLHAEPKLLRINKIVRNSLFFMFLACRRRSYGGRAVWVKRQIVLICLRFLTEMTAINSIFRNWIIGPKVHGGSSMRLVAKLAFSTSVLIAFTTVMVGQKPQTATPPPKAPDMEKVDKIHESVFSKTNKADEAAKGEEDH